MNMKRNKIMALAMLCSTLLSPVSKAHGGTNQDTQKSSDSDKNLQNISNKNSDNPQEMYNSRWKISDIVEYIEYVLGTMTIGGVSIYGGKKVYNKYIHYTKVKKIIEPKEKLTRNSIAEKIRGRLDSDISEESPDFEIILRVHKKVVEDYKVQKGNGFQKIIETKIPDEEKNYRQFITWFQELNNEALDILLEDLSDEEKQFAKENFKFYSFVWVNDEVDFVIAFAPKEKKIDLEGKKGVVACGFGDDELFGSNFSCENYNYISLYCGINK